MVYMETHPYYIQLLYYKVSKFQSQAQETIIWHWGPIITSHLAVPYTKYDI